jgi:hypothetical protein
MGFAYSDGSVEDDRFAGAEPAEGGEVPDLGGGDLRVRGEVEAFKGDLFFEFRAADPAGQCGGLPAADLVFAEDLQEFQVPEGAGPGLRQSGVEGFEHPGEFQRPQRVTQRRVKNGGHEDELLCL